jgi:hypothetical protein
VKLCRDCRWGEPGRRDPRPEFWRCGNPRFLKTSSGVDYVTGQPPQPYKPYANDTRDDPRACGPDGDAWEARGDPNERGFGPA